MKVKEHNYLHNSQINVDQQVSNNLILAKDPFKKEKSKLHQKIEIERILI